MAHDIFISYSDNSEKDREVANAVCNNLENEGLKCWIKPRDIKPEANRKGTIIDAINESKLFVLILSKKTETSKWIEREVSIALNEGIAIIPFVIENTEPQGNLKLLLNNIHRLNAVPPNEKHIENLSEMIKSILNTEDVEKESIKKTKGKYHGEKEKKEDKQLKYSPGLILGWQIAALEANYSKHKYININHVFIGICSLEKVLFDYKLKKNLSTSVISYIEEENKEIIDIFWNLRIDIRYLRRKVRVFTGIDNYEIRDKVIHRDKECKIYFEDAEIIAKKLGSSNVRCTHILMAILENPSFNIKKVGEELKIDLNKFLEEVLNKTSEFAQPEIFLIDNEFGKIDRSDKSILSLYGVDLTEKAREGKIEPIVGREKELFKIIGTLTKKKKSNPLLIGEAGVGKTALIRGLALKIAAAEVPPQLHNKKIIEINMGNIVAGTRYRGDFEEKITKIIDEIQKDPDIIIFIDEIHTIVGAGRAGGNLDASNILKTALSQGNIKCIGATTVSEYRKYFEKDSALERRFQPIMILEPTNDETILILKGLKKDYETYHNLKIDDQALESAVELSVRYLHDRNLPDKALDILDEACSKKSIQMLNKSSETDNIITEEDIVKVLEDMTGIPIKIKDNEIENVLNLSEILKKSIIGQEEAIEKVSRRLRIARSGLQDPNRPVGVFLFLGPTGVGKTELAKTLSLSLFGNDKSIIRLDMSEYMDKQSLSKLIGAAPGYVGYGEEGYLTGALKTNPYSIVLLDEIEKANFKIFDLFLQVFDEGILTDGKGTKIDAKNSIFIMTSNITISTNTDYERAYGAPESAEFKKQNVMKCLMQNFRQEFLNRIDEIIIFNELEQKDLEKITRIRLSELAERLFKTGIKLGIDDDVVTFISKTAYEENFGARPINRVIGEKIEDPLSKKIISKEIKEGDSVLIRVKNRRVQLSNE